MYELTSSGSVLLVTTEKHSYTVTSLLSGTIYSFMVKPYNLAGEGPSAVTEVTTAGGKLPTPTAPPPDFIVITKKIYKALQRFMKSSDCHKLVTRHG